MTNSQPLKYCVTAIMGLCGLSLFVPLFYGFLPFFLVVIGIIPLVREHRLAMVKEFDGRLLFFLLAAWGLGVISTLWSVNPEETLHRTLKLTGLLAFGYVTVQMASFHKKSLSAGAFALLFAFFIVICILLCVEFYFGFPFHAFFKGTDHPLIMASYYNRTMVALMMFFFPLWVMLRHFYHDRQRHILTAILLIVFIFTLFSSECESAKLGFMIGVAVLFFFPYKRERIWYVLAVLCAVLIFAAPLIAPWLFDFMTPIIQEHEFLEASSGHGAQRLEIYDFVARYIHGNPLYGFGLEATKSIDDFDRQKIFLVYDRILHPHNFALQLWIEFGVIGACLGSAFLAYLFHALRKNFPPKRERGIVLAMIGASLCVFSFGYGLWQGWLIGLNCVSAYLLLLSIKTSDKA